MPTPSPSGPPTAESLFAAWLARHGSGEECDFESLVRDHPGHEARLRELHEYWQKIEPVLHQSSLGGSLAERLKNQYGSSVDPRISLSEAAEGPPKGDFSSKVLTRLAGRGPASTRYRLEGEIAHGGMGAILGVWDEDLRRHLAMKVMLGKGAGAGTGETPPVNPKMLSRFLEEAQVTGQLDHPGIVPVHELGLDAEGRVFFTMKLVKGKTLKDVFDELARGEGGWTQTRVLGLLLKVCEAMSYAHAKGVIHRDLKPANVMVGRFGEVYVMDWGLAKVMGRADEKDIRVRPVMPLSTSEVHSDRKDRAGETPDSPLYTMDGDVVGTPAYMPPEQATGDLDTMGPHSDVYAIGAMLYHLIAGHMPYVPPTARASNYMVLRWVQEGPPRSLHEVAPNTPAELVAICEKAMAREVADRYPDTAALAEDLSAYVEGRVVRAYETGAWAETRKWVRRNKPLAASLAAAVVLLVVGLVTSSSLYVRAEDNATRAFENEQAAKEQAQLARDREVEAKAQERIAKEQAARAEEQGRIAKTRADDVLRLSALQDLEDLIGEAQALWPPHPENIGPYRDWITKAESLVGDLPRHRAKREELRALAIPGTDEQRQSEQEGHPEFRRIAALAAEIEAKRRALLHRRDGTATALPEVDWGAYPADASGLNDVAWPLIDPDRKSFGQEPLGLVLALRALELAGTDASLAAAAVGDTVAWAYASLGRDAEAVAASRAALDAAPEVHRSEFEGYLAKIESWAGAAGTPEGLGAAEEDIERLERELQAVESRMDERRAWRFPEEYSEARWWDAQLTKLIEGLEALQSGLLSPDAVTAGNGWSVGKRQAFARGLETGFASGGAYASAWERDLPAIREAYPGLELGPQMGLLPIGPDPNSGLWEFAQLLTGEPAERGADGKLVLTEETGVVLVLIPSGSFWMGAQSGDPSGRNHDPQAQRDEGPVHEVELSAYFLSKYELTQGQWLRLTGRNPSNYQRQKSGLARTLLHPVERVSWLDCMEWFPRAGLALPSEAQWEHGARGGTDTVWWTGSERESLREGHAANLADRAAARAGANWQYIKEWPELDDGYAVHAPVGTYAANAFGLHEVHGNLFEWCQDGYDSGFYAQAPRKDPVAAWEGAATRVNRGGCFSLTTSFARSAYRRYDAPSLAGLYLGVRPARAIDP